MTSVNEIIAKLFPKAEELQSLETAKATLTTEKASLETEIATLKTKLAEYETKPSAEIEVAKVTESLKAEHKATVDGLQSQLEIAKTSLAKEVAAALASKGVPTGTIKEEKSPTLTSGQIVAQWNGLEGQAKQDFYQQNRLVILKEVGLLR